MFNARKGFVVLTTTVLMITIVGCAGSPAALSSATPQQLANESNYNICRAAFSNRATRALEQEVNRRQVDCRPYLEQAARDSAAMDASLESLRKSAEPPATNQRAPAPTTTNCTTQGTWTHCTSY